ncbi:Uma2 family endonuclease [Streptomyces sp. NPDC090026]|uniref:Uma2 family endonuclease n=1 Tax=Streptomyces sp. NPDC090026 TaxID=3365923 RepID=UPI00381D59DF
MAHQRAAHRLAALLDDADAGIEVLPAVNVNLDGRALAVPDVTVVRAAAAAGDRTFVDAGDVLLAVEIATAGTVVTDRFTRPALYAEAGIRHLWRLDLEPAPTLWVGTLEGGAYSTVARILAGRSAASQRPSWSSSTPPTSPRRPPADHPLRPEPRRCPRIADATLACWAPGRSADGPVG